MSNSINDRERLKRILDLSDQLGNLRRKLLEKGGSAGDVAEEVRSIAGSVAVEGLPGELGRLASTYHYSPQETLLLLLLLNRRIGGGSYVTGREMLSLVFPSAYGVLSGAALLLPGGSLRRSGAVVADEPDPEDPLDGRFRLGDGLFAAVSREVSPRLDDLSTRPYRSHFEHLADLGQLTSLLLRRSNAVFRVDPFGHRAFDDPVACGTLERRAAVLDARITGRLAATPGADQFPIVRLARRHQLSSDEQYVLVALLVQECYFGNPGIEAVDCVKMVSASPEDLLRKRTLLASNQPLRREGLVELTDPVEDRELTAEVSLPRWMVSLLVGDEAHAGKNPIGPDTRLEFHEYLKRLGDSDEFYRDLEG